MSEYIHTLQIGSLLLKSNIIQAPLASYSSRSYRHLSALYGSPLAISEMVSVEGLLREGEKTLSLVKAADTETLSAGVETISQFSPQIPYAVQLFGSSIDSFKKAVCVLLKHINVPLIDINAACPVQKVMKNGCGSSLMRDPKLIKEIVKSVKEESGVNVSVKIRLGLNKSSMNYLECATSAFEGGADMIALHTRTAEDLYRGDANEEHVKILKEHFKDKIILASGDIFSQKKARETIAYTNADGVLAARGAIGNPFIFSNDDNISDSAYIKAFKEHIDLHVKYADTPLRDLRKFAPYYLKHIKNAKNIKDAKTTICSSASSYDDFINALDSITLLDTHERE